VSYNNKGLAKQELEDYYGAIVDYNKAIELDPNLAVAYANKGLGSCFKISLKYLFFSNS